MTWTERDDMTAHAMGLSLLKTPTVFSGKPIIWIRISVPHQPIKPMDMLHDGFEYVSARAANGHELCQRMLIEAARRQAVYRLTL